MSERQKFKVDSYTADNLANAKLCETQTIKSHVYVVCPHCHVKVDGIPWRSSYGTKPEFASGAAGKLDESYASLNRRKPGAELKCCLRCGGVFLDPRFREAAIGGYRKPKNHDALAVFLILSFIVVIMAVYVAITGSFRRIDGFQDLFNMGTTLVVFPLAVIPVVFILVRKQTGLYKTRDELGSSRARLKNLDYLRALNRLGRPLPVKYRNIIEGRPDDQKIYRALSGSCEFCGYLLKEPELCRHFGSPLLICPECRKLTYDGSLCELSFYPPNRQEREYDEVLSSIDNTIKAHTRKALISGLAGVLGLLALAALIYFVFLAPDAPGLLGYSRYFPGKLRMVSMILAVLAIVIGFYFHVKALAVIMRCSGYRRISMKAALAESEHRLRNPEYAANVRSAVSLYEAPVSS
ncbi:hypothetical protein [Succinimonas sp.]|uniref:hypothetical protein n=1 Tax=Succinimonas sp. TaxID=1936151 RepID=UPI00386D5E2C